MEEFNSMVCCSKEETAGKPTDLFSEDPQKLTPYSFAIYGLICSNMAILGYQVFLEL